MAMYTFHICNPAGISVSFEAHELVSDGASFAKAGELLAEHLSCDHVEVWRDDRAILGRHRYQPIIRPVSQAA